MLWNIVNAFGEQRLFEPLSPQVSIAMLFDFRVWMPCIFF